MTLTVIPSTLKALHKNLTEIFEISNPFVIASEGDVVGWNQEIPVEEILMFISEYHKRLSRIIGDLVIVVNFEESSEFGNDYTPFSDELDNPKKRQDYAPSMN